MKWLRWFMAGVSLPFAEPLVWDLLGVLGVGLIAIGLWLIYPPLAFLGLGGASIGVSILGARTWIARKENRSSRRRRGLN